VLCLLVRDDLSNRKAQENKAGLRRILQMAALLKDTPLLAAQGHESIQKLISLVFKSEADEFLCVAAQGEASGEAMGDASIDESDQRQQSLYVGDGQTGDSDNVPITAGLANSECESLDSVNASGPAGSLSSNLGMLENQDI
jgi:hypothetical protein